MSSRNWAVGMSMTWWLMRSGLRINASSCPSAASASSAPSRARCIVVTTCSAISLGCSRGPT
eukprot:3526333-Amphidinium_carterae.1